MLIMSTHPCGDVPSDTFIESLLSEDPESSSKDTLDVLPLLILVVEFGRLWESFRKVVMELCSLPRLLVSMARSGGVAVVGVLCC